MKKSASKILYENAHNRAPGVCFCLGGLNKYLDKCRPPWLGDKEFFRSRSPKTALLGGGALPVPGALITTFFGNFFKYHFYDLKVTFGYIGKALNILCQNIHRSILRINIVFSGPSFTASFDILNTKRLISPKREGFGGSNFDRFILGLP